MKEIIVKNKKVLVDDSDYYNLIQYKWVLVKNGKYVAESKTRKYMHRIIMNAPKGSQVDHINGNPFDNQRCNLRFATQTQNRHNRIKKSGTKNNYVGVTLTKSGNYESRIRREGKSKQLGMYKSEVAAGYAYYKEAMTNSSFTKVTDFPGYTIEQLEELLIIDRIK